jgi:hypothetical protein
MATRVEFGYKGYNKLNFCSPCSPLQGLQKLSLVKKVRYGYKGWVLPQGLGMTTTVGYGY